MRTSSLVTFASNVVAKLGSGALRLCLAAALVIAGAESRADDQIWPGKADWDRTVALAKQEGKVVVSGSVGPTWRAALTSFEKDYGIKVEYTPAHGRDFWPRVILERKVGKFLWDLRLTPGESLAFQLLHEGRTFAPVRDMLVLPEVIGDQNWVGGLDGIFADRGKRYFIGFGLEALPIAWVNRDVVPEAELRVFRNLADPRWKGKISLQELRSGPATVNLAVLFRDPSYGESFVDDLVLKNRAVLVQNARQQVEWLVRGKYPIAIAILSSMLIEFKNQGLAANVLPLTDILKYTSGSGGLMAFANAPHPNATKVYANWLLSRAAQMRIAQTVGYNSRRTDVPAGEPLFTVDPSRIDEYLNSQSEEMLPYFEKVVHYARKVERLGAGVPAR